MKTKVETDIVAVAALPVLRCLIVALVLCSSRTSAAEFSSTPGESKTHTLFMGADVSVEQNKTMYRVLDVQAGAFLIKVKGKEVRVAADWANVVLKVDPTLKLTDSSASVTNLKSERAYTLDNDPTVQFQRGLAASELSYADSAYARRQADGVLSNTQGVVSRMTFVAGAYGAASSKAIGDQMIQSAQQNENNANAAPGSSFYNHQGSAVKEGDGMFDAMEITFEAAAQQPLNHPYVVIIGQFRDMNWKQDEFANWVYAQPLQPITAATRKVHIFRGGFPRGFEMQNVQLHLYDRGREIATDVAPRRVALTREEAFLYARMDYLSSHKGATLPAREFMGKLPPAAKAQISAEQFEQPYYVKVTKEGDPAGGFLDTSCSRRVDGTVAALIANVRFYPALENGNAVEGVAELNFSRLAL